MHVKSQPRVSGGRPRSARALAILAAAATLASGAGLWAAQSVQAQEPRAGEQQAAPAESQFDPRLVEQGFRIWKTKIVCGECHGWSGNGVPDNPRQPKGMNLRQSQLTHEQLVEVIKCGRPGTGMPHFDQRAYKDDRCYGVTAEDLGDQTPPGWGAYLIPREIEAVATYVEAKQMGRGDFTDAECQEYFGAGANICKTYQLGGEPDMPPAPSQGNGPH